MIYCHPDPASFTAAVRNMAIERLEDAGAETRLIDLYAADFNPVLGSKELRVYLDTVSNRIGHENGIENLLWCNTLIFIYPTWWYGLPAMLKGWLDRTLLPGIAFHMPGEDSRTIQPGLLNISRLAVYTTCGASWLITQLMGSPGKRTLLRGVRSVCAPGIKTSFSAHYLMDSSTSISRTRHLERTARKLDRLLG